MLADSGGQVRGVRGERVGEVVVDPVEEDMSGFVLLGVGGVWLGAERRGERRERVVGGEGE